MSFLMRQSAHCDQCSHEWLVVGASTPTHCAKCKSRRWNEGAQDLPRYIRKPADIAKVIPATPKTLGHHPRCKCSLCSA